MIEKIKKGKKVLFDLFFNTLGFGIYIVTQQLLLMPILAKIFPEEQFSEIVLYISVFAIITNVIGNELGIVRQVKKDELKTYSDYNRILVQLLGVVSVVSIILLIIFHFSIMNIILLTITILLGNTRLYAAGYFRLNKDFKRIVIQNVIYAVGIGIGLFIVTKIQFIALPMLLAELLCLLYDIFKTDLKNLNIRKTEENKKIWYTFKDFGFISFLVNMTTYFDKIIIYPILGENAVAVYYATSSMSKVVSLITNPLHGVILSWLKGDDENFKSKVTKLVLKINIPILLIIFIFSIPVTYIAVKILYPQYLQNAIVLILPISLGMAFNTVATLVKAILMKYTESKNLVKIYVIYILILIVSAVIMSYYLGIIGFAYATTVAKFALWIMFIILLNKVSNKTGIKQGEINEE